MEDPGSRAGDVDKRMRQLRALRDILREQLSREQALRLAPGGPGIGRGGGAAAVKLTPARAEELRKASVYVGRLTAAIDEGLEEQWAAAQAHGASLARDRRAAEKLCDCVAGIMSASALAEGLAFSKPYHRQPQTIQL